MKEVEDAERGRKLLNAVERILDDTGSIIAVADRYARIERDKHGRASDGELRDLVAKRLVRHYSKATAIAGGLTALPSMLPGLGTLATLTGGTLVDVGLMLKFEVEMALALCHAFGYDITRKQERQLAFLLASISAYDIQSGDNFVQDVAVAEGVAIWNYAPRQAPKVLVHVMAHLAARSAAKGVFRAVPVVGVAFGTVLNKTLTKRVGQRCIGELTRRRSEAPPDPDDDDVVDAVISKAKGRPARKAAAGSKGAAARKRAKAKQAGTGAVRKPKTSKRGPSAGGRLGSENG